MSITTAYWCMLIAGLLPYIWVTVAKSFGKNGRYNNQSPREWMSRQTDQRTVWANAAQLNSFEGNPAFFASVLMAQFAGVAGSLIGLLAVVYVVARVLHGVFYITGMHALRSAAWFVGFGSVLYLMFLAARAIA